VITVGRGGTGGLETSALALGLAAAALRYLAEEAEARPELNFISDRLQQAYERIRQQMHEMVQDSGGADQTSALRARANSLVLRATQAALTASKGTGFLRQHPAQRWARQALFFLVWSCPRPAAEATLAELACQLGGPD
jgi:butyryl-CoA dehydrogenase